jgi:hypothetical protein
MDSTNFRRPLMQQTNRRSLTLIAVVLVSASAAFAQTSSAGDVFADAVSESHTWRNAQLLGTSQKRLYVVTFDKTDRRHPCRVQSLTSDKLVCARMIGGPRIYELDQIAALIIPGDGGSRLRIWLGLNAGLGAAIWGTVVLTATCPACAAATALVALLFFGAAGATAYADGVPDRLLYLAPGQKLSRKLGYVRD